jgi:hypothetical protein
MCLRFVFLLITRTTSWLQLSRSEETWRITEILILRHQLAVLQRRQPRRPKLNWADRPARDPARRDTESAAPGAAAAGHPGHHAALAPGHRPPPLGHQVHARQGRPATRKNIKTLVLRLARENPSGDTADPRGTGRPGSEDSRLNGVGDSQEGRNRPCAAPIRAYLVAVPAISGRGDPGVRLSSPPTCSTAPRPMSWPS